MKAKGEGGVEPPHSKVPSAQAFSYQRGILCPPGGSRRDYRRHRGEASGFMPGRRNGTQTFARHLQESFGTRDLP
jgi:hypothetical protein